MERFKSIISNSIKEVMSDVYITGGHPLVSRKQGVVQSHPSIKWSHQEVDDLVRKLLKPRQLDALRERKSLDFAMSVSSARLRINVFTTTRGLSMAVRVLPGRIPTIDELNLHPSLNEIAKLRSGLILVCGPTGAGKTTTIAAIINEINNTSTAHIVTLENPIEYRFRSNMAFIQQRELGAHMPSFAQGLIDVLRENPDVIVVGEIRKPEEMLLTLNAAEAGHLVIATLHASTPEEALFRLCNAVPVDVQNTIRYQLASTLSWLIVQQLGYLERIGSRVPVLTIVRNTQSVKNVIRENKLHQLESAIQIGKNEGMFSSERYLKEYLESRKKFTSPFQTFSPSEETFADIIYESPLTEDKPERTSPKRTTAKADMEPIFLRSEYTNDDLGQILTISDDVSMEEMINNIKTI